MTLQHEKIVGFAQKHNTKEFVPRENLQSVLSFVMRMLKSIFYVTRAFA